MFIDTADTNVTTAPNLSIVTRLRATLVSWLARPLGAGHRRLHVWELSDGALADLNLRRDDYGTDPRDTQVW